MVPSVDRLGLPTSKVESVWHVAHDALQSSATCLRCQIFLELNQAYYFGQARATTASEAEVKPEFFLPSLPCDLFLRQEVQIVKNLDTDGSGNIDYTEFMAATLTKKQYLRLGMARCVLLRWWGVRV